MVISRVKSILGPWPPTAGVFFRTGKVCQAQSSMETPTVRGFRQLCSHQVLPEPPGAPRSPAEPRGAKRFFWLRAILGCLWAPRLFFYDFGIFRLDQPRKSDVHIFLRFWGFHLGLFFLGNSTFSTKFDLRYSPRAKISTSSTVLERKF